MAEQQYDLFFRGDLVDGFFRDFVLADLQALFKANDAYMEGLFSGQEQLIKQQVDKATAIKYQRAFKQAGAKLIVRSHQHAGKVTPTVSEGVAKADPTAENKTLGFTDSQSSENDPSLIEQHQPPLHAPAAVPSWDLAAPGVDLGVARGFTPTLVDTSALTIATLGADLLMPERFESPTPIIDTGGLSLAPVGSLIETLPDQAPAVRVDISHLRVEPL
ncbi:MAG: hypothetical protein ACI9RY_000970 [Reinekea sp.]|jgi:hypothetical protein